MASVPSAIASTTSATPSPRYVTRRPRWAGPRVLLDAAGDAKVAALLGLDRAADFVSGGLPERELPEALVLVGPTPLTCSTWSLSLPAGAWAGAANPLSGDHVRWGLIEDAAAATVKPPTDSIVPTFPTPSALPVGTRAVPAATLIRQRRSAVGYDGRTSLDAAAFYTMLNHLLPRPRVPPWDVLPWQPLVHAAIFVHRVRGLPPGLYLFERDPAVHESLHAACRPTYLWQRPTSCPDHLTLYLLEEGDPRAAARTISCHQDIAADGACTVALVAAFGDVIRGRGRGGIGGCSGKRACWDKSSTWSRRRRACAARASVAISMMRCMT